VKARLLRIAKLFGYVFGYLTLLFVFFYLTFPMDALRGRILAEFESQQRYGRAASEPVMTLEIGELDTYWLSGIELEDLKLTVQPKVEKPKGAFPALEAPKEAAEPSVIEIEHVHARVRLLPLLVGKVMVDFRIDAFGGTVRGSAPYASTGNVEVELEDIHLDRIAPLRAMLQNQPVFGVLSGNVLLTPEDGKFAKANGKVDLQLDEVSLFDGKSKLFGVALPAAQIGRMTLAAKADKGLLTVEELSVQGKDLELAGEGKVRLHETYKRSTADLYLKFKFADGYRDKDDATRSLLGKPGSKIRPAIEELDPQRTFVRAKTEDDFYRFHLVGRLDKLDVQPAGAGAAKKGSARSPLNADKGLRGALPASEAADEAASPAPSPPSTPTATPSTEPEAAPAPPLPRGPKGLVGRGAALQGLDGDLGNTETP
jgi:type II secretion system protein N